MGSELTLATEASRLMQNFAANVPSWDYDLWRSIDCDSDREQTGHYGLNSQNYSFRYCRRLDGLQEYLLAFDHPLRNLCRWRVAVERTLTKVQLGC